MTPSTSIRPLSRSAAHRVDAHRPTESGIEALETAVRHLDAAELRLRPVEMAIALLEVGHCHRCQGSLDAAEWYLQRGLAWSRTLGASHLSIDTLCELAATCAALAAQLDPADPRRAYAARERARDHGYEAATLAARTQDPRCEAAVLGRVSDALEHCGDTEDSEDLRRRQGALLSTLGA
ncbi:MAG: hypothetical protein MUC74_00075 [Ideonella sp.]|jgi:hypothetical protein|nr:hypothetical protein [Ideonella sp.]